MNVQPLNVTRQAALTALREYKAHRDTYDDRDWEIERIYRAIAKGNTIISVEQAIVAGGVDQLCRPRLAICRADQQQVVCEYRHSDHVAFRAFGHGRSGRPGQYRIHVPWTGRPAPQSRADSWDATAQLPRIPPQHRPVASALKNYYLLWEADWTAIPRDPALLRRIGRDAWLVLAVWDLTDVEISVLRAHQERQ